MRTCFVFLTLMLLLPVGCGSEPSQQAASEASSTKRSVAEVLHADDDRAGVRPLGVADSTSPGERDEIEGADSVRSDRDNDGQCQAPAAIPFRMAAGVQAAGYGLNTNDDGVRNFGELATDCGGAGQDPCVDIELDVQIKTRELLPPDKYGGFRIHHVRGTLNGRDFEMMRPEPGQLGLTRDNVGLVIEHPTRRGHHHAPPNSYGLGDLVPGQQLGATAIALEGVTGGHPYVFSAQEAVLASRYLREVLGLDTIVVSGGSYGGAASLLDASAYPEHFDGVVAVAAPYNGRVFAAWSELNALRSMAADLPMFDPLYYPGLDGLTMAAAQRGLSIENLDITRLENAHVPAIVLLGEADHVWLPGTRAAADRARMEADGMDWVDVRVIPEEQHGGARLGAAILTAYEDLYTRIDELRAQGHVNRPALCASPRRRDTTYDPVMRTAPEILSHPRVTPLWSDVTQLEPGYASRSVAVEQDAVFSGSVQGFVTRRDLSGQGASTRWSVPVGRAVQAISVSGGRLVVGSKRGIAVLNTETGDVIRETTGLGSVTDVVVADLIAEVPGLEIAARADMDILHVERLDGGELLSASTIGAGGGMQWSSFLGAPSLLVPMQRGHVVSFRFQRDDESGWVPVAHWISDYLAHDISVVYPTISRGQSVLLAAGSSYAGRVAAILVDPRGRIVQEISLNKKLWNVATIAPWTQGEVLAAGIGGVVRIDLERGTASTWSQGVNFVATGPVSSVEGPVAVQWARGFPAAAGLRITDQHGTVLHQEIGRATTPAMDVYVDDDTNTMELSVMNRYWSIERFDLFSGEPLGSIQYPVPAGSVLSPRRLVRTAAAPTAQSYQPFLSDGDMFTSNVRVATRCGSWIASTSLIEEQGHLFHHGDLFQRHCAASESDGTVPPMPGFTIVSERVGSSTGSYGQQMGALRFVDIDGPRSHAVMSTAGGQVVLYSAAAAIQSLDTVAVAQRVTDVAGTITSLAVGSRGEESVVAVGSWLPAQDGASVHLLAAETLDILSIIDAGPVLGVAMADLDRDGVDEVLVGTQDGYLKAFDLQGEELLTWSAGDFQVAENGAIFAHQDGDQTLVAFAVAGGFRVVAIAAR